jgi:hypothetical protein
MTSQQAQAIQLHGENLNRIFNTGLKPIELCKKLRRIQGALEGPILNYCNGDYGITSEQLDNRIDKALDRLDKILNFRTRNIPVFVNRDPRGYALKIDDEYIRIHKIAIYRDWGGYGILAPTFDKFGN